MTAVLDDYSELIGQIYDASLDVAAWPEALEAACRVVGAPMGTLGAFSSGSRTYDVQLFHGYEARWIDLYRQKYAALNPLRGSTDGQAVGEIRCLSAAGLIGAFAGDPMYEEWVKPQRIHDLAEVVLDASPSHAATLTFVTRVEDGLFTPEAMRRIELLFPHVRRSVMVSRVLAMHGRGDGLLDAVIDELAAGVFVLGRNAEVLRSNRAGAAMLAVGDVVCAIAGALQLNDPQARQSLNAALRPANLSAASAARATSVPLHDIDGRRFVAHMLPLSPSGATREWATPQGRLAVIVGEADPDLESALTALARTYDLTAAETRVARGLAEIGSAPMIARAQGVSVATVRTHLRSLYAKSGTRRQADFIALLRGFASPFG